MERINFREQADLGKMLQKSAQFIRQNFVEIMKSAVLIVLIPLLLGSFLIGSSMVDMFSGFSENMQNPEILGDPFFGIKTLLPGYFFSGIAYMLFYIVCISYIKQYVNGAEIIDQNSVFADLKKHVLSVFFGGLLIGILSYIGMILCLIPGIYLAVVFSHLFCIIIIEDKGFGTAFSKSFKLIKGHWWDSFLLYFVATLINMGISFVMILPMYIYLFANMFENIESNNPEAMMESMGDMGWFMPIYMLVYLIGIIVVATIQSANYYNLVERQEGTGEKLEIEGFGK